MITHKARFNTKAYTAALRQAADLLEQIDTNEQLRFRQWNRHCLERLE